MSNARKRSAAFTLFEMLVATAIMAVLAGSLYATLHVAFRARRTATSAVAEVRQVGLALELVRTDIRAAVVPRGILAGAFVGEQGTNAFGRPADTLLLHCTAPASQPCEGVGDIRLVELLCAQDDDGTTALIRRVTTNLLRPTVGELDEEILCRNVYAFALRYFDGLDWLDNWDSTTQDNQLPAAIELTLQLNSRRQTQTDAGGYQMSRVFLIPSSTITAGVTTETALF
jgi:prepilin-type N-terminal cleavage/methylation domain-containing protein